MTVPPEVRVLGIEGLQLIADIDRSEHVEVEFAVRDGGLVERPVSMTDIPPWDPVGTEFWSVAEQIAFCEPVVRRGGVVLGAFAGAAVLGLAVVEPRFQADLAWLTFLHVSRAHRRRGAASALWDAAVSAAVAAGATSMYVSAVPTGSAVGFYLSRGCRLADPVHPGLFTLEPDDIHLVCPVQGGPGDAAAARYPGGAQ